jgi:diguanylate cyclase (GGDEF)-like protein
MRAPDPDESGLLSALGPADLPGAPIPSPAQSELSLPLLVGTPANGSSFALPTMDPEALGGEVVDEPLDPEELLGIEVFRGVKARDLEEQLDAFTVRRLRPDDFLLARGVANQTMYVVLSGRLSVHLDNPRREAVAHLAAGQVVGEASVVDGSAASAWVRACEETLVLGMGEEAFWALVHASHDFAINLLMLFSHRIRATNTMVTEGARKRRELERQAYVDALTGCYNRRWLDERLPRLTQRFVRRGAPLSLLVLDVDHFKRFNDDFGHQAGDCVLVSIGRGLVDTFRPTDMPVRQGGEEYVVLLPDTPLEGACVAAERFRLRMAGTTVAGPDGRALPRVTVSIGVAELRPDEVPATLIARADEALYRAKRGGRNRVERG